MLLFPLRVSAGYGYSMYIIECMTFESEPESIIGICGICVSGQRSVACVY